MSIRNVCIASCPPAEWPPERFALGEFIAREGAERFGLVPGSSKQTLKGTQAVNFARQFDALITWNPMNRQIVDEIQREGKTRVGLVLAVEAITAMPQGDVVLDTLRNALLPLTFQPPIDYCWNIPTSTWHSMAVDFERKSDEVYKVVTKWLLEWVRPLNLSIVMFDCLQARRLWFNAPNVPPELSSGQRDFAYQGLWKAIVSYCQAHVAPVWGHNSGVGAQGLMAHHKYRVEEHFYRLPVDNWWKEVSAANTFQQVLVRSGEWRDIEGKLGEVRKELDKPVGGGDAWIVSARSGGAFGVWA